MPGTGNAVVDGASFVLELLNNKNAQNASHDAVSKALRTLEGTEGYAEAIDANGRNILKQMIDGTQSLYGDADSARSALQDALMGISSLNPYKAGSFSYGKTIKDFFDPAYQLSVDTANAGIDASQALGGNLFSSDTADKIAAQNQVLATQMYEKALDAMNADRSAEASIWQGNEAAKQAAAQSAANLAGNKLDAAMGIAGNIGNAQNDYYQALLGLNNDYYKNKTDYASQVAALQAQDPGKAKGLLGLGLFGL